MDITQMWTKNIVIRYIWKLENDVKNDILVLVTTRNWDRKMIKA